MKFYYVSETKCRMHCISGVAYSVGTKATHRKAVVYYAAHVFISRKSEKNLMPKILHFCVPALLLQFQAQ